MRCVKLYLKIVLVIIAIVIVTYSSLSTPASSPTKDELRFDSELKDLIRKAEDEAGTILANSIFGDFLSKVEADRRSADPTDMFSAGPGIDGIDGKIKTNPGEYYRLKMNEAVEDIASLRTVDNRARLSEGAQFAYADQVQDFINRAKEYLSNKMTLTPEFRKKLDQRWSNIDRKLTEVFEQKKQQLLNNIWKKKDLGEFIERAVGKYENGINDFIQRAKAAGSANNPFDPFNDPRIQNPLLEPFAVLDNYAGKGRYLEESKKTLDNIQDVYFSRMKEIVLNRNESSAVGLLASDQGPLKTVERRLADLAYKEGKGSHVIWRYPSFEPGGKSLWELWGTRFEQELEMIKNTKHDPILQLQKSLALLRKIEEEKIELMQKIIKRANDKIAQVFRVYGLPVMIAEEVSGDTASFALKAHKYTGETSNMHRALLGAPNKGCLSRSLMDLVK